MNIYKSGLFPYIEGAALVGKGDIALTMTHVSLEELPNHRGEPVEKPILYFEESEKGLILNKTNAKTITALYGGETDDWRGKRIALYAAQVKAFGKMHDAVRIREAAPAAKDKKKPAAQEAGDLLAELAESLDAVQAMDELYD